MAHPEKVILVIPAFNEEQGIRTPLEYAMRLKKQGVVHEVLVVDDGSADMTSDVAKRFEASVLRLEKNVGKGGAFIEGALYCKKAGADVVVLLDADMISAVNNPVPIMLDKLRANDLYGKPFMMAVTPSTEGNAHTEYKFSGQRAIRIEALNFLFAQKDGGWAFSQSKPAERFRQMSHGYGLEAALNWQVTPSVQLSASEYWFKFEAAFRKGKGAQVSDINNATNIRNERFKQVILLSTQRRRDNKLKTAFAEVRQHIQLKQAIAT